MKYILAAIFMLLALGLAGGAVGCLVLMVARMPQSLLLIIPAIMLLAGSFKMVEAMMELG